MTQQTLEHYFNRIKDLVWDHGEAWHLIVEEDAKARKYEGVRKMRTLLQKADNKDGAFRMLAEDEQLRSRNVINPSNRWSSKGGRASLCPDEELVRILRRALLYAWRLGKWSLTRMGRAAREKLGPSSRGGRRQADVSRRTTTSRYSFRTHPREAQHLSRRLVTLSRPRCQHPSSKRAGRVEESPWCELVRNETCYSCPTPCQAPELWTGIAAAPLTSMRSTRF